MGRRIYLDHHATTPVDPRVLDAMAPYMGPSFGNASSSHVFGWEAAEAVERASEQVARLVGSSPREVVFTSGATESNNLALIGAAEMYRDQGRHLVTTSIEHPSVLDCCRHLESRGFALTVVDVGRSGVVEVGAVVDALREDTILCSVMAANNEIGTIQPIPEIAGACRERGILFQTDAVQAVGRIPVDFQGDGIDLLSLSAHKLYGPKGIGALIVRRRQPRVRLAPLLHGGGHQRGLRAGTLPVPLIVGLGAACAAAQEERRAESDRLGALADRLQRRLRGELDGVELNGEANRRLPANVNLRFHGVEAEALLLEMPDIAVSSGSACSSDRHEPSHVLLAIGLSPEQAHSSVRFGLGRTTTAEEIEVACDTVIDRVRRLRDASTAHRAIGG